MPYYCDHGVYATSLGAAPTWGVPQEGDGSSKDAATASSTAAIVLTLNPTVGNTITLCGVVFTAVASGATGNQFNVGALLTNTLDNIAAAINASTTAVASGVAIGVPQLRNLVFARNTSGTTLEVMMRVGSAVLNGATNTNCRLTGSGITTSTTLPVDFAGGSGGCWGLLFNTAAIGVSSSYAALAYGLMVLSLPLVAVASTALTTAATPTIADTIYIRTGSNPTLTVVTNTVPNIGAHSYPQNLLFDTNTIWTGDSATGAVTIALQVSGSSADLTLRLAPSTASTSKFLRCIRPGGLKITWASSGSGSFYLSTVSTSGSRAAAQWEGVVFEELVTGSGSGRMQLQGGSSFSAIRFKRCSFWHKMSRTTWAGTVSISGLDGSLIYEGCDFLINVTAGADPGPAFVLGLASGSAFRMTGCSISGWSFGKIRAFAPGQTFGAGVEIAIEGCTGFAIGAYLNLSTSRFDNPWSQVYTYVSSDTGLGFRHEYAGGVFDWNPDASPAYPTRNALLMDNTTPWSVKMDWFANTVNALGNLTSPRMGTMNRISAAARTVTVDFLTPVTVTTRDVAMRVNYIGTDGLAYAESTYGSSSALSSPGATWAGSSNFPSHSSRRLSLTTSRSVKQNTEIAVYIEATGTPPGGSGIQIYIDPEMGLS